MVSREHEQVDAQIVVILKYLRRLAERTRVIVCSGNHDLIIGAAG
jgi:hypothetical protein